MNFTVKIQKNLKFLCQFNGFFWSKFNRLTNSGIDKLNFGYQNENNNFYNWRRKNTLD
jgi:hypothetical protein